MDIEEAEVVGPVRLLPLPVGFERTWYLEAKNVTLETLPEFMRYLYQYHHTVQSSICAATAGMLAALNVATQVSGIKLNRELAEGIVWELLYEFEVNGKRGDPMRIINYLDIANVNFRRTFMYISPTTWAQIVRFAKIKILTENRAETETQMWGHWSRIARGIIPWELKVGRNGA